MKSSQILHLWFTELTPKQHFAKDAALDEAIRTRFGATLEAAAQHMKRGQVLSFAK